MFAVKWFLDLFRKAGLLPKSKGSSTCTEGSCCDVNGNCGTKSSGKDTDTTSNTSPKGTVPSAQRLSPVDNLLPIESMEEWSSITQSASSLSVPLIVFFTASWCKPCQSMKPLFKSTSQSYDALFCTVDVDEMDELAERATLYMMPTFAVYEGEEVKEKFGGANEVKFMDLIDRHVRKIIV